jgi:hypothetical protein
LADRIPHVAEIAIDWRVLGVTIGVAALTSICCAVASLPGLRRLDIASMASGGTAQITGRSVLRRALLSSEVAVTFVLLVGAALLAQTLWNLAVQDRGTQHPGTGPGSHGSACALGADRRHRERRRHLHPAARGHGVDADQHLA